MNDLYGKLTTDGFITYAPPILQDLFGRSISEPTEQDYKEHGYKKIIITEVSEDLDGKDIEEYCTEDINYIYILYREINKNTEE